MEGMTQNVALTHCYSVRNRVWSGVGTWEQSGRSSEIRQSHHTTQGFTS